LTKVESKEGENEEEEKGEEKKPKKEKWLKKDKNKKKPFTGTDCDIRIVRLKRGGDKMSIQIFGLNGYDFSLKELASFLGK